MNTHSHIMMLTSAHVIKRTTRPGQWSVESARKLAQRSGCRLVRLAYTSRQAEDSRAPIASRVAFYAPTLDVERHALAREIQNYRDQFAAGDRA